MFKKNRLFRIQNKCLVTIFLVTQFMAAETVKAEFRLSRHSLEKDGNIMSAVAGLVCAITSYRRVQSDTSPEGGRLFIHQWKIESDNVLIGICEQEIVTLNKSNTRVLTPGRILKLKFDPSQNSYRGSLGSQTIKVGFGLTSNSAGNSVSISGGQVKIETARVNLSEMKIGKGLNEMISTGELSMTFNPIEAAMWPLKTNSFEGLLVTLGKSNFGGNNFIQHQAFSGFSPGRFLVNSLNSNIMQDPHHGVRLRGLRKANSVFYEKSRNTFEGCSNLVYSSLGQIPEGNLLDEYSCDAVLHATEKLPIHSNL